MSFKKEFYFDVFFINHVSSCKHEVKNLSFVVGNQMYLELEKLFYGTFNYCS